MGDKQFTDKKEYLHQNGTKLSDDLSSEEKEFIVSMAGYKETAQIPMLTDKIMVLNGNIKRLNKSTTFFSIVLIIFAIIQIIILIV